MKIHPVAHRALTDSEIVGIQLAMMERGLSQAERNANWLLLSDKYDIDTAVHSFINKVEKDGGAWGEQYDLYDRLKDVLASRQAGGPRTRRYKKSRRRKKVKRRRRKSRSIKA